MSRLQVLVRPRKLKLKLASDALRCARERGRWASIQLESKSLRQRGKNWDHIDGRPTIFGWREQSGPIQQSQHCRNPGREPLQLVGFNQGRRWSIDIVGGGDDRKQQANQTQYRNCGSRTVTVHSLAKQVNSAGDEQAERNAGPNEIENCFQALS